MKRYYYIALISIIVFEILKVYYIMPMPGGSQEIDSIDLAYFLHSYRWTIRVLLFVLFALSIPSAFSGRKWVAIATLLFAMLVTYLFNFKISAEKMFLQPNNVELVNKAENKIPESRLILGIEHKGEAKAYPIEVIAYHHQVFDSIGGKPVIVTYCSVCRTGRVYEPVVNGKVEKFRLVGMDHYNAMFEDETTKSWWRQSTGEAIKGDLKSKLLPEFESKQMTLGKWFELYPNSLVMQEDKSLITKYDPNANFEKGKMSGRLLRTDSLSWKDKSWVVGIQSGNLTKAYDWNDLKKQNIINDSVGKTNIIIILSKDGQSFAAFERPNANSFTFNNDTIYSENDKYDLLGRNYSTKNNNLKTIRAYQEFWHSWKTFHPNTEMYNYEKQ